MIAVVFVDLLGMSIIIPLAPFYADKFGATDLTIGLIIAAYPFAQFLAAPHLGRWSDRWGRRPVILISLAGTVSGFLIWAGAESLAAALSPAVDFDTAALSFILLGRVLDGISGGNITVCQAYITDVTDSKNRAKGMGLIGAAHGAGFIFGPPLGGYLSADGNYALPALVAAAIALANLLAVAAVLPESLKPEDRDSNPGRKPLIDLQLYRSYLGRPQSGALLQESLVFGACFGMFQTTHSLFNLRRYDIGPEENGLILAYVGVIMIFIQGWLIGRLSARFGDEKLLLWGLVILCFAFFGWAWAPSIPALLAVLFLMALGGGILGVSYRSALSKTVSAKEVGGLFGVKSSLGSLLGIGAPLLGTSLLEHFGTAAPGLVGGVVGLGLLGNSLRRKSQWSTQ